jgi:hypothetical protein
MNQNAHAYSIQDMVATLPKEVLGWRTDGSYALYDSETIFNYIDGAGEVYRAYNLHRCLVVQYSRPDDSSITLDIFEMKTSADAFGVFTHDTSGNDVKIGNDGRYRVGWLSFWKDRFFVSLYMEFESVEAEKAVLRLGRHIEKQIPEAGTYPKILKRLPSEGLIQDSIRFLHHHVILNYHFYFSNENILGLNANTDAVLAEYEMNHANAKLLLVRYPEPGHTKTALSNIFKYYIPEADQTRIARLETNKWAAASVKSCLLVFVIEADSKEIAQRLLKFIL